MSFTSPKTWSSALVTVSDLNTYVSTIETELQTFLTPTVLSAASITPGTNVTVTRSALYKQAGMISGLIQLTPGGSFATQTAGAGGDLSPNYTLCTLPAGWLPNDTSGSTTDGLIFLKNDAAGKDTVWNCIISGGSGALSVVSSTVPSSTLQSTDALWVLHFVPYVQVN